MPTFVGMTLRQRRRVNQSDTWYCPSRTGHPDRKTLVLRLDEAPMAINITPLHPVFVGAVSGIDLTRTLSREEVAAVEAGMDRYAVLVFHDQPLTDEQQMTFSRNFGELEATLAGEMAKPEERRMATELGDISNVDHRNRIRARDDAKRLYSLGNRLWHTDASFRATGAIYSLLSARVIPSAGGNTEFADMRAAYDALDDATKREIEGLVCEHSIAFSRAELGFAAFDDAHRAMIAPVRHRLVSTHPVTGRKSLYLASHIGGIVGWPVPEARAFIRDLMEHATQPRFVHAHVWRVNDLVMWDNRTTMHRARRYDDMNQMRDMRRTTLRGTGIDVEQTPRTSEPVAAE
jgi:alpha-ketoglutarate-dependent 2,4-dichlorophenoxyacetate dioxygenase